MMNQPGFNELTGLSEPVKSIDTILKPKVAQARKLTSEELELLIQHQVPVIFFPDREEPAKIKLYL